MRNFFLSLALLAAFLPLAAQTKMEPWQDPNIFEENRMPMRATFVTDQQQTLSLNGLWKFYFNPTVEGRLKGFEAVNFDDRAWDEIPVPGMWDLYGYCDPMYLNIGYPWKGHYENNPPYPALEHNYVVLDREADLPEHRLRHLQRPRVGERQDGGLQRGQQAGGPF